MQLTKLIEGSNVFHIDSQADSYHLAIHTCETLYI